MNKGPCRASCRSSMSSMSFFLMAFLPIDSIDATSRREIVQDADVFTYDGGHLKLIIKRTEMPRGSAVRQCSVQVAFADLWRVEPMLSLAE